MIVSKTWRDHVPSGFLNAANKLLKKSRDAVYAARRKRASNWIECKLIESGIEIRGNFK